MPAIVILLAKDWTGRDMKLSEPRFLKFMAPNDETGVFTRDSAAAMKFGTEEDAQALIDRMPENERVRWKVGTL